MIDWKPRFFVPTDDEPGVDTLTALLNRYPVLIDQGASQDEVTEPEVSLEMRAPQVVDLEQWIVAVSDPHINRGKGAQEPNSPPAEPTAKPDFALTAPATTFSSDSRFRLRRERDADGLTPKGLPDLDFMSAALYKLAEPEAPAEAPAQDAARVSGERLCALPDETPASVLTGNRLLASEAMRLLIRLDAELRRARAQWESGLVRRLMQARSRAVLRLRRRWEKVDAGLLPASIDNLINKTPDPLGDLPYCIRSLLHTADLGK